MPAYNQLSASSLLNQQYAAALGLVSCLHDTVFSCVHHAGSVLPGLHVRRGPMVEKAVQTLQMERSRQWRGLTPSQEQEQRWDRRRLQRTRGDSSQTRRVVPKAQQEARQQTDENRPPPPPPRRRQGNSRRRRNRSRGQLMVANAPSATLKFDTDFDFDSSNAQFIKEELEREGQDRMNMKEKKEKGELHSAAQDVHFGPKYYYDKAKSFFDNISSDNKFRLTWAEERKRNLETFGVPGRFLRGQGFRGGYTGRRGRGAAQSLPSFRTRSGQL
uniref:LSM family member 14B n=1 Tax=Seriola lalandi dorsalis TaxID=1841481 RepID=A0A3B4XRB8_SERLL